MSNEEKEKKPESNYTDLHVLIEKESKEWLQKTFPLRGEISHVIRNLIRNFKNKERSKS